MHEVQTYEGLGNFDFLFEAQLKSASLAYPSSVAEGDSFPPQGKLKGAPPEGLTRGCCFGNLPPWGKLKGRRRTMLFRRGGDAHTMHNMT